MFVPKSALAIVSHCDSECSRYALGSVQFERGTDGKALAIATDGRRLAVLEWADLPLDTESALAKDRAAVRAVESLGLSADHVPSFSTLLSVEDLKKAGKMITAKPSIQASTPVYGAVMLDEVSANGKVTMGATNGSSPSTMTVASTEGRFPKWRDVLPSSDETITVKLDPKYLAEACKLLQDFATSEDNRGITLTLHKATDSRTGEVHWDEKPVVLAAQNCEGRSGKIVIMPLAK